MVPDILAQYRQLLQRVDRWFAASQLQMLTQIACAKGCCGCCRGLFDITLLDAYLLQRGARLLEPAQYEQVMSRVHERMAQLQQQWPDFTPPYILNLLPHNAWMEMPEDDLTPCPLLGDNGLCLVYEDRPLTCRLHGIANIDFSGKVFSAGSCTLNFQSADPLTCLEIRGSFEEIFRSEVQLLQRFNGALTGRCHAELDTFIPSALLIDFETVQKGDFRAPCPGGNATEKD